MRSSMVILFVGGVLMGACGLPVGQSDADGGSLSDSGTEPDSGIRWLAQAQVTTPYLQPGGDAGCLVPTGTYLAAGEEVELLALSSGYALLDESGTVVSAADLKTIPQPANLPPGRSGSVMYNYDSTPEYVYGAGGCLQQVGVLKDLTPVEALARSYDLNYHGNVVIDRQLHLAPVRQIDADGWTYPWHAGVQIVKPFDGGFVVGAGVVIGPSTILTAKHMGVDPSYCYSREAASGPAWAAGKFVCDNIAGAALDDPTGVDAATVSLINPIPPPYAKVRTNSVQPGDAFFTSRWGTNSRNVFGDSAVVGVDNSNAWCAPWPASSSLYSLPVVACGDSGGPAWIGDELVGIVHGQRCEPSWEPEYHVFVHVPGLLDFIRADLPDGGA